MILYKILMLVFLRVMVKSCIVGISHYGLKSIALLRCQYCLFLRACQCWWQSSITIIWNAVVGRLVLIVQLWWNVYLLVARCSPLGHCTLPPFRVWELMLTSHCLYWFNCFEFNQGVVCSKVKVQIFTANPTQQAGPGKSGTWMIHGVI